MAPRRSKTIRKRNSQRSSPRERGEGGGRSCGLPFLRPPPLRSKSASPAELLFLNLNLNLFLPPFSPNKTATRPRFSRPPLIIRPPRQTCILRPASRIRILQPATCIPRSRIQHPARLPDLRTPNSPRSCDPASCILPSPHRSSISDLRSPRAEFFFLILIVSVIVILIFFSRSPPPNPHPATCIPHPASCILHPASCIPHPARLPELRTPNSHLRSPRDPAILHPASCIPHPASCIPHPASCIRSPISPLAEFLMLFLMLGWLGLPTLLSQHS